MAEAGWTGLLIPENIGGSALGMSEQAVLSEALGRELISEPVSAGCVFAATLLGGTAPSSERDRLASGLASGSLRVVPACRRPDPASGGSPLVASFESDGVMLMGDVHFVDAALSATDFLVVAASGDGAVLLSVPRDANGLVIHTRPGVDGGLISSLRFDGCRSDLILDKHRVSKASSKAQWMLHVSHCRRNVDFHFSIRCVAVKHFRAVYPIGV